MISHFSETVIDEFSKWANHEARQNFRDLLKASLQQAKDWAHPDSGKTPLSEDLYNALAWPQDLDTYIQYLRNFAEWAPVQSGDPPWKGADGYQEIYDRLCHFYWLINQDVGQIVQNFDWFKGWLVRYAQAWGSFLDTPHSFSKAKLESFRKNSPKYAVDDSMIGPLGNLRPNAPSGWLTFNQFFARELNPGLRTIADPTNNFSVTSPADCTYKAKYKIGDKSNVISNDQRIALKGTHTIGTVHDLLKGSSYSDKFANGTFVHYFLGPYSYHRFHMPVAGRVLECYSVQEFVYLDVKVTDRQFDAPDSSEGGYEFAQSRGILVIDTTDSKFGNIGLVAVVPVGMAQVSSVNMTMTVGKDALKGDEFGYFLFGGSDIIVLLQGRQDVDEKSDYRHYGSQIATWKKGTVA